MPLAAFDASGIADRCVANPRHSERKRLAAQGASPLAGSKYDSIIQTIKANTRGFRSFENFRIRILFFCGKFDLQPGSG